MGQNSGHLPAQSRRHNQFPRTRPLVCELFAVVATSTSPDEEDLPYRAESSGPFPPGTEVKIRERRSGSDLDWLRVRLLDDSNSWIPASTVETIPDGR